MGSLFTPPRSSSAAGPHSGPSSPNYVAKHVVESAPIGGKRAHGRAQRVPIAELIVHPHVIELARAEVHPPLEPREIVAPGKHARRAELRDRPAGERPLVLRRHAENHTGLPAEPRGELHRIDVEPAHLPDRMIGVAERRHPVIEIVGEALQPLRLLRDHSAGLMARHGRAVARLADAAANIAFVTITSLMKKSYGAATRATRPLSSEFSQRRRSLARFGTAKIFSLNSGVMPSVKWPCKILRNASASPGGERGIETVARKMRVLGVVPECRAAQPLRLERRRVLQEFARET